jgi:hypothetical protein
LAEDGVAGAEFGLLNHIWGLYNQARDVTHD